MAPVLLKESFFEGAGIHPHPDRDPSVLCAVDDRAHLFLSSDISGIDADLIRPLFHRKNRHPVVEVDIRYEGERDLPSDLSEGERRLPVRYSEADDLTARSLQSSDLLDAPLYILCLCIAHGLNGDRISSPDL